MLSLEAIIFYAVLIDALFANLMIWFYPKWYAKKFKSLSRWFPPSKGWCLLYLVLVIWMGCTLYRLNIVTF